MKTYSPTPTTTPDAYIEVSEALEMGVNVTENGQCLPDDIWHALFPQFNRGILNDY